MGRTAKFAPVSTVKTAAYRTRPHLAGCGQAPRSRLSLRLRGSPRGRLQRCRHLRIQQPRFSRAAMFASLWTSLLRARTQPGASHGWVVQAISILTGRRTIIPRVTGLNMSSKPHGGSVASAALLTIPPGALLICANSWTRVAAIAGVALGDLNSRDAIVISFLNVIPKRPGSVLGSKLTKTSGSLQTEAKSLPAAVWQRRHCSSSGCPFPRRRLTL